MRSIFLTFILSALLASPLLASPAETFAEANKAFDSGEFEKAYSGYKSLIDDGKISADLFYNLGNASYRLERSGEAVLWYRRCLILDPTHKESRQNLRFLQRTIGIPDADTAAVGTDHFRRNTLVRVAMLTGWLAVLGIAAALTLRMGSGLKTCLWIASPLLALIGVAAAGGVYLKHLEQQDLNSRVIVTAAESKALASPARAAESVIELREGTQLLQLSKRGSWDYIDIPGDLRGWVPESSITPLWPYDPNLAD